MPRVQPNDDVVYNISIESKVVLDTAFRTHQGNIVEILQSTTMFWQLGVRMAPEKQGI